MLDNFFTRFPQIDLFSFIAGLILGAILYIVSIRLLKLYSQFRSTHRRTIEKVRVNSSEKIIDKYKHNSLKRAQFDHLLGPLFPLSEIYVPIPLIYPYPYVDPKSSLSDAFEASSLLPFVSDTLEFYESIPFRSKSLPSAIKEHNLIMVKGNVGSGKSTLFNNSISSILENRQESSSINGFMPFYIHHSELNLESNIEEDPLQCLLETNQFTNLNSSRPFLLSAFLPFIENGNAIIFIDGLDEATPSVITHVSSWISSLLKAHPLLKIVIAVNNSFTDGFQRLGFTPFVISPINTGIRKVLISKIIPSLKKLQLYGVPTTTNIPVSEEAWLRQNSSRNDIFSLTLSLIGEFSYSGSSGSTSSIIKDYINRFTNSSQQLEQLVKTAESMYAAPSHTLKKEDIENIFDEKVQSSNQSEFQVQKDSYFQLLTHLGFLVERQPGFYGFRFHHIFCYLLSKNYSHKSTNNWDHYLFNPIENFALAFNDEKMYLQNWLTQKDVPLYRNIGSLSLHFEKISEDQGLINNLLPLLLHPLDQDNVPFAVKLKYLSLILHMGYDTPLRVFEYLSTKSRSGKVFAILGYGFYNSIKSLNFLKQTMISATPLEKAFCALSLLRIGNSDARSIILESLNLGDDLYRRLVCEMLSVDKIDGLALLKELSSNVNISIRKGSIYGIKLLDEPWVVDFLTNLSTKDGEWIVRDTAAAALEEIANHQIELHNPTPLAPDKIDWLLEVAGKKDQSISTKSIPNELLMEIVLTGTLQQKLASLNILSRYTNKEIIDFMISLFENDTDLGDQSFFYISDIATHDLIT